MEQSAVLGKILCSVFEASQYRLTDNCIQITHVTPHYSGKSFLEAMIGLQNPFYASIASKVAAGTYLSIGSGKLIITQRQGNGSYRIYFGLQVPEDFFRNGSIDVGDVEATRSRLLSDFYVGWSEEYRDFIRYATDFRAWPLYTLSSEDINWKHVPGVTVAGDAAHLSIPNGEGVNVAMTDALELALKIAKHGIGNLDQAVQEYEAEMFPRGAGTINDGQAMAGVMFAEGPQGMLQMLQSAAAQ